MSTLLPASRGNRLGECPIKIRLVYFFFVLFKLRVPHVSFLARSISALYMPSSFFSEFFLFISFFLSVYPASRIASLCCALLYHSLSLERVTFISAPPSSREHLYQNDTEHSPQRICVPFFSSLWWHPPPLRSLVFVIDRRPTGVATFKDFGRQGRTNRGPGSGMTSPPSPPTTAF